MTLNHRPFVFTVLLGFVALGLSGCGKKSADAAARTAPGGAVDPALASSDQKVSYAVGYNLGASLARDPGLKADADAVKAGLADGLSGAKARLADPEVETAFAEVKQRIAAARAEAAEKQRAAGAEFLAKNKSRDEVKTTASGLQYEVLKTGTGAKPKASDTVRVHYHGMLTDGKVFDSSVERGQPAEFPVTGVIKGWVEALQLMGVGDKWKLTIPSDLAYGERGAGADIPPNSVLVFEVELLEIKAPAGGK